jgi:arylsulfatase A-like enzyme
MAPPLRSAKRIVATGQNLVRLEPLSRMTSLRISKRRGLPCLAVLLLSIPMLVCSASAAVARPNILFLLADDLRWDALGCTGNRIVQTPHIDRLATRGAILRNHFVTTSICNVSRASILSGQHARRHGIVDFTTPFALEQWQSTYPARLRAAGYRTGFIGKFGVGNDKTVAAMTNEFDYWSGLPGQAGLFFERNDPAHTHKTARFGNEALEFLRKSDPARPFCLSVSFNAPHARDGQPREFWPDARDESLYAAVTIPGVEKASVEWFDALPSFVRNSEGRRRWEKRFATAEMFQRTTKDYYRLISGIDREVGRIVALLEERGLSDNTVIVFTSDNGFFLGERGLADKWLMYEESIRVPLIVFDPRRPAPRTKRMVDALTLNIDFAPTLLELAGVRAPASMQGRSLVPLLKGTLPADWRTDFFYEHYTRKDIIPPSEGLRTERWKYIRWVEARPVVEELYDLRIDPGEERNLVADARYLRTLADLRTRWETLRRELK